MLIWLSLWEILKMPKGKAPDSSLSSNNMIVVEKKKRNFVKSAKWRNYAQESSARGGFRAISLFLGDECDSNGATRELFHRMPRGPSPIVATHSSLAFNVQLRDYWPLESELEIEIETAISRLAQG